MLEIGVRSKESGYYWRGRDFIELFIFRNALSKG